MSISAAETLEVENLDLHYGAAQALKGVSLSARRGEVTVVMGRNGVGKTSLIRAITGRCRASGGSIRLDGRELLGMRPEARARIGVAVSPQGREIFPLLTVEENLETGFACLPRGERRVPEEIFSLFPVLLEMRRRRGGDLSGGQQQQLAIARALVTRPKLLVLDEPTEGVQPSVIKEIGRAIELLRERGEMAIVLVEQYFDFAHELADRVVVMDRGAVTMAGGKGEVAEDVLRAAVSL